MHSRSPWLPACWVNAFDNMLLKAERRIGVVICNSVLMQ